MLALLLTAGGGLLAGRLRGGRLGRLAELPVRRLWLLLLALIAAPVALRVDEPGQAFALAAAVAATLGFLVANPRLAGAGLVGVGLVANSLVVAANAGMPVSLAAAREAGLAPRAAATAPGHLPAGAGTVLAPLGDLVPLPLPAGREVLSGGDILILAGLGALLATGMVAPRREASTAGYVTIRQWRRRSASGGRGPSARPTTASGPTPESFGHDARPVDGGDRWWPWSA